MRYRLSPLAERDLDEIWLYVASAADAETADRLVDGIGERFSMLAMHPKLGVVRPELGAGARCFAVKNYVIYYREEPKHLLIARIVHGSRDQVSAWRESPEKDESTR